MPITTVFVSVQSRGQIALPPDVRRRHHLDEPGAQVEVVERDDGVIELHPHVAVPVDQQWFWRKTWLDGERRVDEHVVDGKITVSNDIDSFLADLDHAREG